MFKLTGCFLIVISVTVIFSDRLIKNYLTYIYLTETHEILLILKTACKRNKTYNSVINSIDKSEYQLFFSDYKNLITDKKQTDRTMGLLQSLGKRNKEEETEYIQYVIEQTEKSIEEYKMYYDTNKKSVFLSGISLGIIIIIVLI